MANGLIRLEGRIPVRCLLSITPQMFRVEPGAGFGFAKKRHTQINTCNENVSGADCGRDIVGFPRPPGCRTDHLPSDQNPWNAIPRRWSDHTVGAAAAVES